jgi:hypothetical protein
MATARLSATQLMTASMEETTMLFMTGRERRTGETMRDDILKLSLWKAFIGCSVQGHHELFCPGGYGLGVDLLSPAQNSSWLSA